MPELEIQELVEAVTRQVLDRLMPAGRAPALPTGPYDPARPLVAANWKMSCASLGLEQYLAELAAADRAVDVVIFPPAVMLSDMARAVVRVGRQDFRVGSQDLHWEKGGAHTGELSGQLVRAAGGRWTLVGHSERRGAGETDGQVSRKLRAGLDAGLSVMLCVGETLSQRRDGSTFRVLRNQLHAAISGLSPLLPSPARLAVAYEPIWAIGTGEVATASQVQEAAAFVRRVLEELLGFGRARDTRVLYGGSVKPTNAAEIMACPDVGGLLVGGASLAGSSFREIVDAAGAGISGRRRQ